MLVTGSVACAAAAARPSALRAVVTLALAGLTITEAASPTPPSEKLLGEITQRGRMLAAYDHAAWHGSDAVMARGADKIKLGMYLPYLLDGVWRVAFGKRNEDDTAFLVGYEATEIDGGFAAESLNPPRADTDVLLRASLAADLARKDFGTVNRPYNFAAIPAPGDQWWVYFYPASTELGIWPLGGDVRYTIDKDGKAIVAKRRLHNSIIETGLEHPEGAPQAHIHTHILECIPEDTDVLAAIARTPSVPEFIVCDPFIFSIDIDGTIRLLGLAADLKK